MWLLNKSGYISREVNGRARTVFVFVFRHLESIRPLCDDNEFNKFVQLSKEFETTLGKRLQRWLQLKWWTSDNYVSDWWEEYVYLRGKN